MCQRAAVAAVAAARTSRRRIGIAQRPSRFGQRQRDTGSGGAYLMPRTMILRRRAVSVVLERAGVQRVEERSYGGVPRGPRLLVIKHINSTGGREKSISLRPNASLMAGKIQGQDNTQSRVPGYRIVEYNPPSTNADGN